MHLDDFQFQLPSELIACYPLPRRRDSRLLCLHNAQHDILHRQFSEVIDLVRPGDLLVFNNTKVIPARLFGHRVTGGRAEVLIERVLDNQRVLAQVRVSKSLHVGEELVLAGDVRLRVGPRTQQFYELCYPHTDKTIWDIIDTLGQIPLPPYMHRLPDENDKTRYQTVYAAHKGSVAAPTAGLHFDETLLAELQAKQVEMGYLTLHIGAGTFSPIRVEDVRQHQMHAEYIEVSPALCAQIEAAKQRGSRVIAVGTTSLRALESACHQGVVSPFYGETRIFIYPGHVFHSADVLITNLHLPKSTLLMLVCAFGGQERVMRAYLEAVTARYRFYSYGDAMWVEAGR